MDYLELLRERARKSRVYSSHQLIGLTVAQILGDEQHKSLYIKLAKEKRGGDLIELAKSVAERRGIQNKGAYFMRLVQKLGQAKKYENHNDQRKERGEVPPADN
ncbi:MAG: hypothetical protein KGL39_35080 [Patescibacteria group bacterium]|nr:hypothetical protein [Patescibacteria group bacterium]